MGLVIKRDQTSAAVFFSGPHPFLGFCAPGYKAAGMAKILPENSLPPTPVVQAPRTNVNMPSYLLSCACDVLHRCACVCVCARARISSGPARTLSSANASERVCLSCCMRECCLVRICLCLCRLVRIRLSACLLNSIVAAQDMPLNPAWRVMQAGQTKSSQNIQAAKENTGSGESQQSHNTDATCPTPKGSAPIRGHLCSSDCKRIAKAKPMGSTT